MYATDLLLRVGYLISHLGLATGALFTLSTAAYVYRAILEERFVARDTEYRAYMERVRWRFIPGLF